MATSWLSRLGLAAGVAIALAGCALSGDRDSATPPPPPIAPEETPTSQQPTPTVEAATAAAASPAPEPTRTPPATPTPAPAETPEPTSTFTPLAGRQWSHPFEAERIEHVAVVDDGTSLGPRVAIVADRAVSVMRFGSSEMTTIALDTMLDEFAFVADVVAFRDDFLMAVADDFETPSLLPRILRWDRGDRIWIPIATTVTRPAASASHVATPPSPPWGGRSGITDLSVHDGVAWATGWATVDGQVRGALWSSLDAIDWQLELLPAVGEAFGPEYGAQLAVSDLGVAVALGNSTHFGAGVVARAHGGEWQELPFPEINDAGGFVTLLDSEDDSIWVVDARFDGPDRIHRSRDLREWETFVNDAEELQGAWVYQAATDGPRAWFRPATDRPLDPTWYVQWSPRNNAWMNWGLPGRFVGLDSSYVITRTDDELTVSFIFT